jgi:BirA family biotin operon repressor/biotin-[acetyl-CoA-carboxylase] ligase
MLSGRKTAGILVETGRSNGVPTCAAIGIGINIARSGIMEELADRATSISEQAGISIPRRWLLVRFLYHFQVEYGLFERGGHSSILEHWKGYSSMWDGVPVWICEEDRSRRAIACGLSPQGALLVRTPEGKEEMVLAADVRVRRSEDKMVSR